MKGLTTYRFTDFVEHNDSMFTLGAYFCTYV